MGHEATQEEACSLQTLPSIGSPRCVKPEEPLFPWRTKTPGRGTTIALNVAIGPGRLVEYKSRRSQVSDTFGGQTEKGGLWTPLQ